jgi:hypothetical protein
MMSKTYPEILKVRFVSKVSYVVDIFTGREEQVKTLIGDYHLFEIVKVDGHSDLSPYSFCSKARSDIGEQTTDSDKRPENLCICPVCEQAWKADKRSSWARWVAEKA